MQRTLRYTVIAASALAIALFISACGGSKSNTSGTTSGNTSATAGATGEAGASSGPVKVDLSEWKVAASPSSVKAGKVTFDVKNSGTMMHEMVVIKTDKKAGDLGSGPRVSEAGAVGEVADLPAGKSDSVTLDLKSGHYALICNIDGHYAAGMYTDFNVD